MFRFVTLLAVVLTVFAFDEQKINVLNPCSKDITNLCGMSSPRSYQEIFDARLCLKSSNEISNECQAYLTNVSPSVVEPCFEDINKYCFNAAHTFDQMSNCLSKYSVELSNTCSVALNSRKHQEDIAFKIVIDEGISKNLRLSLKMEAERRLTNPGAQVKLSLLDHFLAKIDVLEESLQVLFAFFAFQKSEEETDDELDFKRYNSRKADDSLHN